MLSSLSHAMSVGPRKFPSTCCGAGRPPSPPLPNPLPRKYSSPGSSGPSGRRPRFIVTYPAGLNLIAVCVPLSTIQVVVLVIASAVRVAETIHALAHFAHELTCLIELQELRCRVAVERTRSRAAGVAQDQDVPLGVDGHGEHFSEIQVG